MSDIFQLSNVSNKKLIDLQSNNLFAISTEDLLLPDSLCDSNVSLGESPFLLTYPLIVWEDNGVYRVIDGCKRFLHAVRNNLIHCLCFVLDDVKNIRHANHLRIVLNLNRVLSFREKILFLKWLKENCSDEMYKSVTVQLALSPRECHEFEQIFGASEKVLNHIEDGHLDLIVAPELLILDRSAQDILLRFFSQLQFSRSFQREFIEWIPEIAFRKSCSISDITESPEINEVFNHKSMNPPQKLQKIKDLLFRERFPVLAEAKSGWSSLARKINPDPAHIQFLPSDSFEKNRLELKITISSSDEIVSIFEKLKIITSEQWDKLIYPAKNFDPEK